MRAISVGAAIVAGALLGASNAALAQNSQCQWIGSVWNCNQTSAPVIAPRSGVNWDSLRPTQSPADAFQRGWEIGERARRSKIESERIQAETEMYRAQARAAAEQAVPPGQAATPLQADADYLRKWFASARPRMGLFPDFEKVVFSPDVRISPDMVMLMSSSPFAADIAYHLATHKAEAMAISTLSLLEAAKAIDGIEGDVKAAQAQTTSTKP